MKSICFLAISFASSVAIDSVKFSISPAHQALNSNGSPISLFTNEKQGQTDTSFAYVKQSTQEAIVDVYFGRDDLPGKEKSFGPIQSGFMTVSFPV